MRVKTDAKRQEILDAAAAVLREHGFSGASMAAVSKRIGASKATLYRYFPSKEDLFLITLLDAAHDQAIKLFDLPTPCRDLRAALERFGARFLELTLSPDVLTVRRILVAEGSRSGLGQRLFERGAKISWSKMADFLRRSVEAGRLRDEDPWMMAMHLRGLLEADIVYRALLGADVDIRPANLKRCAASAVDVLLRAYGVEVAAQMAATFGGVEEGALAGAGEAAASSAGKTSEPM
jgi:AcrR family transcriptional regulator